MHIQMSIRQRLALLSLLALVATGLVSGLFFLSNRTNERALAEVYEQNSQSLVRMQRMEVLLTEVRFRAAGVLLDLMPVQGSRNHLGEARGELATLWQALGNGAGDLFADEEARQQFASLQQGWSTLETVLSQLERGYSGNDQGLLTQTLEEQWASVIRDIVKPLQALIPLAQQRSAEAYEHARSQSRSMLVTGMAGAALLLAGLIGLAIWTTRSIVRPMDEVRLSLQRIAEGDLAGSLPAVRRDELGQMVEALNRMQQSLQQLVTQVRVASDSIATASAEVASGNADLSHRTEAAASNLQETAASMEQLSSTVQQSADTAREADVLAANAARVASQGGAMVSQVVSTMQDIEASSRQISDIIGVIDGIAFQTNILALNAAVEAARAGEQGRGFAVVAGEVRSLAGRSAEAARQIRGLIGASVDRVHAGSQLVANTGSTMDEIVTSVQRVARMIGEISAASAEQSNGIGQVNTAVTQLDQMTQQNAALVEQSSAASESLREQADRLSGLVSVFRVKGAT
ncbi:MAG TPA: methyl-accepting chemotaxis protein [Hydrogenophaga sp.]|uniref:methyl-accepting chemotaxis protein n=1 Tax=Hydrogenophaga sp. TaxID=1904254 RepID=UPI002BA8288E|nr:methyl-accepting chemotaxis protein [Hydrogenophaga sp.]HMN94646.1 methyl-accepting chemotaxis protein [Hydrogenophaga sp.]HMP11649.1 methyl-accepting chemotaxis protein [Hydrogenophaga sp.]